MIIQYQLGRLNDLPFLLMQVVQWNNETWLRNIYVK